jgi:hypothetical protein
MHAEKGVERLQKEITVSSLRSLQAHGYLQLLARNYARSTVNLPGEKADLQDGVRANVADVYKKLQAA